MRQEINQHTPKKNHSQTSKSSFRVGLDYFRQLSSSHRRESAKFPKALTMQKTCKLARYEARAFCPVKSLFIQHADNQLPIKGTPQQIDK